jgi:hypothetical protein
MKGVVAVAVLFFIIIAAYYNKKDTFVNGGAIDSEPVSNDIDPNILQKTLTQLQEKYKSIYPINTVYFNRSGGGYEGRFMFLDVKYSQGVQYDVKVDASGNLISDSTGVSSSFQNPFTGYVKRMNIGNLNNVQPTPNMHLVWDKYTV